MSRTFRNLILLLAAVLGLGARAFASATATITVGGGETQLSSGAWDSGNITISFSDSTGRTYSETVTYGQFSTPASIASAFGAMFSNSYVPVGLCAHATGNSVLFYLKGTSTFGWPSITDPSSSFSIGLSNWPPTIPIITWPAPSPITYGTALSATQLNAAAFSPSVSGVSTPLPGTFIYSPVAGAIPTAGTDTLSVTFTPSDTVHYASTSTTVPLVVSKTTPSATWATPASIIYGTALSSAQLNANASVAGTFTYSPAVGAIPGAGTTTLSATFTPTDSTNYNSATVSVSLVVNKATPTITWPTPIPIPDATTASVTLGPAQLNAVSSVPGTFVYAPPAGTVLPIGATTLNTTFTPQDSADYLITSASVVQQVGAALINTVAGNGVAGYSGDNVLAVNAELNYPTSVAIDSSGNLYIADYNNSRIREVSQSTGLITTIAGNGTAGYSGDGGQATQAEINMGEGGTYLVGNIGIDGSGNIYISDPQTDCVREVYKSTGIINTIAGNCSGPTGGTGYTGDGGAAVSAGLSGMTIIAVDGSGNLYIAEGTVIRKVSATTHIISTITGNGSTSGIAASGGPAINLKNANAGPMVTDPSGNLFFWDGTNIWKINAITGIITIVYTSPEPRLTLIEGMAVDSNGDIYVNQTNNMGEAPWVTGVLEFVAPTSAVNTIVGFEQNGYYGDGGPATSAELDYPAGIALDTSGNLYIADSGNDRVRVVGNDKFGKITPEITWSTPGPIQWGAALTSTQLNATASVPGTFTYTPALGATLPVGTSTLSVTFMPTDTVHYNTATASVTLNVTQAMPVISWPVPAAITYTTPVSAIQLNATANIPGTFSSYYYFASVCVPGAPGDCNVQQFSALGAILGAGNQRLLVQFVPSDSTHYSSVTASIALLVNKATPTVSWVTPPSITYGIPLLSQQLNATANAAGTFVYTPALGTVLDPGSHTLSVSFTPSDTQDYVSTPVKANVLLNVQANSGSARIILTVDGGGTEGDFPNVGAVMSMPVANVSGDSAGNRYIAGGNSCNCVLKDAFEGLTTLVAGGNNQGSGGLYQNLNGPGYSGDGGQATSAQLSNPSYAITDASGNVYIADTGNNRIRKVSASTGVITTFAGNGSAAYAGDGGYAANASLNAPSSIAIDTSGNLYIADSMNYRIRKVNLSGVISTVAGNGTVGYSGDGGSAVNAQLANPSGIAVDSTGNLYIADSWNSVVRKVTASSGIITTVAGDGTTNYVDSGDGGLATNATISQLNGVAVDTVGNIYIAGGACVREVNASNGIISTVAGNGTWGFSGDNGPAIDASLNEVGGLFVNATGNMFIADSGNGRVRQVSAPLVPTITWPSPSAISYGTGLSVAQLNATANVPGTFVYTPASGTVLNAGLQTLTTVFTPNDSANYAGVTLTTTLMVNPSQSSLSVTWAAPAPITYGTALSATQLNAAANVAGTFSYSPGIGAVLGVGPQTLLTTFTPTDTVDYQSTTYLNTLTVNQATPVITWPAPAAISLGTPLTALQLNASAQVQGTFVYSPIVGTILGAGTHALTVSFNPSDAVDYSPATNSVQLVVNASEVSPMIASVLPDPASVGTQVTISGQYFGPAQGSSIVSFNGVSAVPISWTINSIVVNIPPNATTGDVVITVNGASSNGFLLMVPSPCK